MKAYFRYQKGYLYEEHGAWYVRYRQRVPREDGSSELKHISKHLVLLCHKRRMQQNGQQRSCLSRNLASLIRSVAIECGLCRSARMRRAAGPEVGRNFLGA